jgi:L-galactonate dehydratase
MVTILAIETRDVRFPTSLDKTGSDAMNAAGDYSSAYCVLKTDSEHVGHGMVRCVIEYHSHSGLQV